DFHVTGVQTCALPIYENTKIRLDLLDNGKLIEGEWIKVSFHDDYDIYTGYVFSGYLINENKLIVPHKKMGIVTNTTTKQDLYKRSEERRVGKEGRARW